MGMKFGEGVTNVYENVKKAVAEKWEGFKKKFEGTKSEMSLEVMNAKSPEDLILLGKKLQEQGEALKLEEDGVKKEGIENDHEEALKDNESFDKEKAHGEALEENKAFEEDKATKEAEKAAEEERKRLQAEENAKKVAEDEQKAAELLEKIKSGNLGTEKPTDAVSGEKIEAMQTEKSSGEFSQEDIEKIYGLSEKDMQDLMNSRGFIEGGVKSDDPNRKEKMEEWRNKTKSYDQVRVKLFDRVLSGVASENEIKMAEEHAASLAKEVGIDAFKSVPKSWYANERLAKAMANTSENNKKWVKYVQENYTSEQLKKGGFEEIGKDGFRHQYNEKGF
jgi:hypothetical protein